MIDDDWSVSDVINEFDKLGIIPHTMPNAVGLWPNEQECLVWSAFQCSPDADWLEVGSFCGGSTILLGLAKSQFMADSKVIAVDLAFNSMFDLNIKRSRLQNIIKIQCNSVEEFAEWQHIKPISFIFLDGYHSFRNVVTEFQLLQPHLTDGAIIAFHDCSPLMWTNSNQTHIRNCYETASLCYDELMSSEEQDFYIDEAIAYICVTHGYKILDIPVRQPLEYFKETGLDGWVRGRTSPHNAFTIIRKC